MIEDTFQTVREGGVKCTTGLLMTFTDDELRNGSTESRKLMKSHGDRHEVSIYYPAGKPLITDAEIRRFRNKVKGTYRVDNWILKSFTQAYKYATGKPAKTIQGYTIQQNKDAKWGV